jgi:hypothetical protein
MEESLLRLIGRKILNNLWLKLLSLLVAVALWLVLTEEIIKSVRI